MKKSKDEVGGPVTPAGDPSLKGDAKAATITVNGTGFATGAVVLLGGVEISTDTLLRWYVLHVLMFPFVIVIFMAVHFWRVRKDGGISGPL